MDEREQCRIPDKNDNRWFNINSDVYPVQLGGLHLVIEVKRPRKNDHIVFHNKSACPHVEHRVVESFANKGWELLPHPPYSPTEAPMDYHINRSLKN